MNKRITWIDVAKGLAILAVIAGHLGCKFINRLVFPWHMPLFFLLAGFFLADEGVLPFIRKKTRALLLPYAITSIAVIIGWMLIGANNGLNVWGLLKDGVISACMVRGVKCMFFRPLSVQWGPFGSCRLCFGRC